MSSFNPGHLVWFFHPKHGLDCTLGFVRDHKNGAYVFGGHTGSHYTGHGEPWTKKLAEIESLGYSRLSEARSSGLVPAEWQPPDAEAKRDVIITKIRDGTH